MASLHPVHVHYKTLLARVGRCLSFGCNPAQRALAANLASCITNAWPSEFYLAAGYQPLRDMRVDATDLTQDDYAPLRGHASGERMSVLRKLFGYTALKAGVCTFETVHWGFGVHDPAEMKMPTSLDRPFRTFYRLGNTPTYPANPKFRRIPPQFQQGTLPPPAEPLPGRPDQRLVIGSVLLSPRSLKPVVTVEETLLIGGRLLDEWPGKLKSTTRVRMERFLDRDRMARKLGVEIMGPIEEGVRALERETWDREDAVEDMGSAEV